MRNGPTSSSFVEPPDTASYDALTDLFLGEPVAELPAKAMTPVARPAAVPASSAGALRLAPLSGGEVGVARSGAVEFEAIVLGHLPVRANPWASQYARAAADRAGEPVALLRMLGGEIWIDLYGVPPAMREQHARDTFSEAIEHAAETARLWIVQCDESEGPSALPLEKANSVTLLCAGNEAAVLAAFQSLKSLAAASPRGASLRVAVMGAGEEEAKSITARLRQSAELFLKRKIEAGPSVSKMGPTGGAPVFRGGTAHAPSVILERVKTMRANMAARPTTVRGVTAPEVRAESRAPVIVETVVAPVAPSQVLAVQAVAQEAPSVARATPAHSSLRASLAGRLAGLTLLPFVCPDDAEAEFARDASGTLHLLRGGEANEALRALTACHAWANKNAALLAMVSPGLNAGEAVQHLFTADPKFTRPLLDSRLRIHLLASVEVEGKVGWCCVELN